MKQITEEQIIEIKNLINTHNSIKVKKLLEKLEEAKDILRDKLRSYLMNQGKSSITKADIWQLLDDTKINEGGIKMEEKQTEETSEKKEEEKSEDSEEEKKEDSDKEDSEDKEEDSE